jgi:peptidoglycan/LPS O-acetylase OafA/YrhL
VTLVFLDHLGLKWFAGGFVGVDVFFVISGYVITRSIAKEAASNTFSMRGFYERRIRRLLPGLAVTTLLAVAVGWKIMLPADFESFCGSVAAASLAFSNVFFYSQTGYFNELSITKPMLHTWSLGVEEQFYFVYPLLLTWILLRGRKSLLHSAFASLMVLSFALATYGAFRYPSATFFLMPTRLWELLMGGVVFLAFTSFEPTRFVGMVLSYGGLGLIAVAAVLYSGKTAFPGLAALVPVLGGVGLILGGQVRSEQKLTITQIMSSPPAVYIGKISYLLYLTHWPLVVYWTYYKIAPLGPLDKVLIVVAATVLSASIYAFVEGPFRSKAVFNKQWQAYAFAAVFMACCCAVWYGGRTTKGFPGRFSNQLATFDNKTELSQNGEVMKRVIPFVNGRMADRGHVDPNTVPAFGTDGPTDIAVFGDSHAASLFDGFVSEATLRQHRIKFYVNYATPPALNLSSWNEGGMQYNKQVVSLLDNDENVKVVIIVANWTMYLKGAPYLGDNLSHLLQLNGQDVPQDRAVAIMTEQLRLTAEELRSHGKRVYILGPVPDYKLNVANTIQRCAITGRDANVYLDTSRDSYLSRHATTISWLERAAEESGSVFIPTAKALWDGHQFMIEKNGSSLYNDYHHLSPSGSRIVAPFVFDRVYPRS